jgi:hypothetical protein
MNIGFDISLDINALLQLSSVLMGTLLGGPMIASASEERRLKGFLCVAVGSSCSLLAQVSAGLYILSLSSLLWVCISLKGAYLNLGEERRPAWLTRLTRRLQSAQQRLSKLSPRPRLRALRG